MFGSFQDISKNYQTTFGNKQNISGSSKSFLKISKYFRKLWKHFRKFAKYFWIFSKTFLGFSKIFPFILILRLETLQIFLKAQCKHAEGELQCLDYNSSKQYVSKIRLDALKGQTKAMYPDKEPKYVGQVFWRKIDGF